MRTIYLECKMGAAGDMLMSALYELLEEEQKKLFLDKMNHIFGDTVYVTAEAADTCGVAGTHMRVCVLGQEEHSHTHNETSLCRDDSASKDHTPAHKHEHFTCRSILSRIDALTLDAEVKKNASAIYRLIGEAESKVHGCEIEQIHFHEVGSLDALADVVGCCLLFDMIRADQILSSPIHVGSGMVHCAHGVLPVPAPATAELLKGIPYYTGGIDTELCTPTGAAILKHFVSSFGDMPAMTVSGNGCGIGSKKLPVANAVRAFLGEPFLSEDSDRILALSCNIDDMTGEALGYAMERLLAEGALDVFYIPVQMKKNRPGILLCCLCEPSEKDRFTGLIFLHTTTRGIRYADYSRAVLTSHFEKTDTPFGTVRAKVSEGYGIRRSKPEFEDVKQLADKNGLPLSRIVP